MADFYKGPFLHDPDLRLPTLDFCHLGLEKETGTIYGPGYGVVEFDDPQTQYGGGCNKNIFILHHKWTTLYTEDYVSSTSSHPKDVFGYGAIGTYRPTANPKPPGVSAFYTDYSNLAYRGAHAITYKFKEMSHGYYIFTKTTKITFHVFIAMTDIPGNVCPPGTVFNPVTGTCDVLDDWFWNGDEYEESIPGVPDLRPIPPGVTPEKNCYPMKCDITDQVVLVPDNIDDIVPPGYNSDLELSPDSELIDTPCEMVISECIPE